MDLTEQDLAVLTERQRVVLELRHGLSADHPGCHSAAEISQLLGLSKARVHGIEKQAEDVLRLWRSGRLPANPQLIGPSPGDPLLWRKVCNVLRHEGFTSWDQVAALSTSDLTEIASIGVKSAAAIAEHLDRLGLEHGLGISADPKLIGPTPGDPPAWTRVCRVLRREGFTSWDQVAALSTSDLTKIASIGVKSAVAIAEHLDRLGLEHGLRISEISLRTPQRSHPRVPS